MSNIIKRTVERENLSAVFYCEFFHSKIVYMKEKIREEQGLVPKLKYKYQLNVNGRYAESALTMKYAEGKAMIIKGDYFCTSDAGSSQSYEGRRGDIETLSGNR